MEIGSQKKRRNVSMKARRQSMLLIAAVSFIVLGSLALMPSMTIAKTIKGKLVDSVTDEKNIHNITVTVRTDAGELKTFSVTDPDMVDGLHMDEPVTVEQDEKGTVTKIIGGWDAKARPMPKFPMDKK
jgi:hypothetical protein